MKSGAFIFGPELRIFESKKKKFVFKIVDILK